MDGKKTVPEVEAPGKGAVDINEAVVDTTADSSTYIGKDCVITTGTITLENLEKAGVNGGGVKFEAL